MQGPPSELEPLFLARFGPGDWRTEKWDVEPVHYLPGLKATLRLTVLARDNKTGRVNEGCFYAKLYNNEGKGERVYQVVQALRDKIGANPDSLTAANPVAYARDLRTVFQEEAQGVSLKDMLLNGDDTVPAARKVARALSTLHLGDIAVPLPRLLMQDEVVALEKRGRTLRRICPHLESKVEEIIGLVVANIEELPPAPVHGDLNLGHVVLDGDRLTLIDLDDFAEADPLVDVARLLASFSATSHRFSLPQGPTRASARAFTEEYFSCVPERWRAGLPLRYAGALLRAASGLFQKRVPGWPEKIEALVEEAGASLRGETW